MEQKVEAIYILSMSYKYTRLPELRSMLIDMHPDLVPYRACDSRTNTLVRCAVWINCCQKGMFGPIMDRSKQLMDVEGFLRS